MFNLRLIERSDLDFITEIRSDPETKKYLGSFVMLSKEKQEKWFDSLLNDSSKMYMIFEKKSKGFLGGIKKEKIGYVRITEIDYINRSMCVGGDISIEERGNGYSKDLYELIFDLGFHKLNMNRLWLLVLEENKRAIHVYEKMGFVYEGRQRQSVFKQGKYLDYLMFSILNEEYIKRSSKGGEKKII